MDLDIWDLMRSLISIRNLCLSVVWAGCGSKYMQLKDMFLKEIGIRAQTLLTIMGSILSQHNWRDLYDNLRENLHFDTGKVVI